MRRIFVASLCVLVNTGLLYAQPLQKKVQLNLSAGYEQQDLKWSIAGNSNGQNPNVYSELKWQKLGGSAVSAALQWNFWNRLMLMADYSRASISMGKVNDTDYSEDNRTNPIYNQTFDADKGFSRAFAVGLGYKLISSGRFILIPYAGYGISKQSLHLYDASGQFAQLNSTYDTDWKGPFIRATAIAGLTPKLTATANLSYHQADYKATADWNLIPTFQHPVSYQHTAKGYGIDASASLGYELTKNIALNLGGGYFTWQTGEGIDELFLSSGGSDKTQLNEVERKGYKLWAGIVLIW